MVSRKVRDMKAFDSPGKESGLAHTEVTGGCSSFDTTRRVPATCPSSIRR